MTCSHQSTPGSPRALIPSTSRRPERCSPSWHKSATSKFAGGQTGRKAILCFEPVSWSRARDALVEDQDTRLCPRPMNERSSSSGCASAVSGNCSSSTWAMRAWSCWRLDLEQGAVGGVLDQRVLEGVGRLGRRAAAEDQLGGDQLVERGAAAPSSGRSATAASSSWENSRPIAAPICATSLTGARRSSRAISESCSVAGIASGGSGPASS